MLWVPVVGAILLWVSPPACTARTVQQGHSKSDRNLAPLREEPDCPGFDSRQRQVIFRFRKTFKLALEFNFKGRASSGSNNDRLLQSGLSLK